MFWIQFPRQTQTATGNGCVTRGIKLNQSNPNHMPGTRTRVCVPNDLISPVPNTATVINTTILEGKKNNICSPFLLCCFLPTIFSFPPESCLCSVNRKRRVEKEGEQRAGGEGGLENGRGDLPPPLLFTPFDITASNITLTTSLISFPATLHHPTLSFHSTRPNFHSSSSSLSLLNRSPLSYGSFLLPCGIMTRNSSLNGTEDQPPHPHPKCPPLHAIALFLMRRRRQQQH